MGTRAWRRVIWNRRYLPIPLVIPGIGAVEYKTAENLKPQPPVSVDSINPILQSGLETRQQASLTSPL